MGGGKWVGVAAALLQQGRERSDAEESCQDGLARAHSCAAQERGVLLRPNHESKVSLGKRRRVSKQ
jgi:hypothetical protein